LQAGHDQLGGTVVLSRDYRIRPLDHLQWVRKQTKEGRLEQAGGGWRPYAYRRTRIVLETALSRSRCEGVHPDPGLIAHLPECFTEPSPVAAGADLSAPAARPLTRGCDV
jgi:hypothetical protein